MIGIPHTEGAAIHRRPPGATDRATVELEGLYGHPSVTIVNPHRPRPRRHFCGHCAGTHVEMECPNR